FEMLLRGHGPGGEPDAPGALGFEDYLRAVGADELADAMVSDTAQAIAAAEAIPGPMGEALLQDYASVVAAHAAAKAVTDNLKSQFLTVLALDIPDSAAGDN